jgi:GNAT superfamily N-acetyltransferase
MILSRFWKRHEETGDLSSIKISRAKNISPYAVQDLCASVGWARRDADLIQRSLLQSIAVISAWDMSAVDSDVQAPAEETDVTKFGELIGFARATGDGIFNATIWDVAVRPDHQGIGVGQLLMKSLLQELDREHVLLITLMAEMGQERFYKKFGFITDPANLRGMIREHS